MTQEELNKKLLDAAKYNDIDGMKEALSLGADVNSIDDNGWTALIYACWRGHTDIVKLLIEHGADINIVSKHEDTALMRACQMGHTNIAELLIEHGADINAADKYGYTAFDLLKENHPKKYDKWIEETVIKPKREKLQKEDLINDSEQDILPDWNI